MLQRLKHSTCSTEFGKAGNAAVHEGIGTQSDAPTPSAYGPTVGHLVRSLVWASKQPYGPFVPPPNPTAATTLLAAELDRLRQEAFAQQAEIEKHKLTAAEAAEARKQSEIEAERAYTELRALSNSLPRVNQN